MLEPSNPPRDPLLARISELPVAFGLRAQGHLPTIEQMLAAGKTWEEIGRAIGWCPRTAEEYFARERDPR